MRFCAVLVCGAMAAGALWAQGGYCGPLSPAKDANGKPIPGDWEYRVGAPGEDCTYVYHLTEADYEFYPFATIAVYDFYRELWCDGKYVDTAKVGILENNSFGSLSKWYQQVCGKSLSLGPDPVGPIASLPQKRRSATAGLPPTGEAAQGFIAADVNGDGIPDQIDVDSGGVGVQLVAANDTVLSSTDFPTGFTPDPAFTTIVAADFNGDGKIDLAVSDPGTPGSNAGGVAVLLGNGDGTFQTPKYFPAGQNPGSLAAADFNGDGKIDLAAASTAGASIVILDGNGDGTFGTPVNYAPGGDSQATPASILALDLNGDGRPDLAVANHGFATVPNSSISVLLNTGGGFQPKFNAPLKLPLQPDYLGWADLNGDGHPDLVAVSTEASGMIVLYGNGDGTFQEPSGYSTGNSPGSLVIQTLGDGNSILMTADQITGNIWMTVVSPQGEVGAPPMHLLGGAPTGIAVADLNGDGQADAVVTGGASDVSVLLSSSGQFQTPVGYSLAQSSPMPQSVTTGDLNNDGKPDLVVASQAGLVSALLGNGDGTFQAPANIQVNQGAQSIALADLDRDHNLDAVVAAWGSQAGPGGGAIVPLLGKGDGTFQAQPALTVSGLNPSSVAAADLNSDGIPDIAAVLISSIQFGSATLAVFPGNGDGTFQSPRTFALKAPAASFTKVIGNLSAIVIGDWNGDGHPDIAVVCQADKTSIDVLLGDGKGNFTEAATLPATEDDPVSIATADLNGDGKPDLVVAHQGGEATYLLGNGDGSFQPEAQLPTGMSPAALAIISASTYNDIVSADSVGALTAVTLPVASFAPEVTMSSVASAAYGTIQLVAPASIATVYGSNLAASVGDTSTTVSVTDSSGAQQTAPLFYVGPGQINFLLADNTAQGIAQVTVTNSIGQSTVNVPVVNVSPGVFELNGSGLAAAVVLIVGPNNSVSYANVYQLDSSNNILSLPIDLSLGQVYLEIYGTGIRNAKSVTVQVGGTNVPVLSSGAQGQYPGLDQVNIGPLPASLAGGGVTNIVLAADGQTANTVNVTFR